MDPAFISAVAALVGSAIGGVTSLATTWLTQERQAAIQRLSSQKNRQQNLYSQFIEAASKLYADALVKNESEPAALVGVYTLLSQMRIQSSPTVIEKAEAVIRSIV